MKLRALHESEWGWKQRGRPKLKNLGKPYQRPERDPLDRVAPTRRGRDVSQELLDKQRDLNTARETQELPQAKPKPRASAEGARLWLDKKQKQQELGPEFDWQPRKSKPAVPKKSKNVERGREIKQRQQGKWKQNPYY